MMASTCKGLDISIRSYNLQYLCLWKPAKDFTFVYMYIYVIKEHDLFSNKILYGTVMTKSN